MQTAITAPCTGGAVHQHLPHHCKLSKAPVLNVVRRRPRCGKAWRTGAAQPLTAPGAAAAAVPTDQSPDHNQHVRQGWYEADLVQLQAGKKDRKQPKIASLLQPLDATATADVIVVGCGPAGLELASRLAMKGLSVGLIGHDVPFVNNYGVWVDEFRELGLEHTLECSWPDALCYFGEKREVKVGRAYGRVSRRKLREHLLQQCVSSGVRFLDAEVTTLTTSPDGSVTELSTSTRQTLKSRLVTLAAGAAAGKFLQYEEHAPTVAAQTAYGIEAEVEGYGDAYDASMMLFMDFRRHHTGLWNGMATELQEFPHPNGGGGFWGTQREVPSFLYAMPLGGNRVFLEETCLVAKPALPFAVLKRRLERRLRAMNIRVREVHEEEWSYIPVGGPLPLVDQPITAFGAAANLIHPATGFSVSRSMREAPLLADKIEAVLREGRPVRETAGRVWEQLWPAEKRRQATFQVFGMELLASLDLAATNQFFNTFFNLPDFYWRGFLASSLTSLQLIAFALITFVLAPLNIKAKLVSHLLTDPAGKYLIRNYTQAAQQGSGSDSSSSGGEAGGEPASDTAVAGLLVMLYASSLIDGTSSSLL